MPVIQCKIIDILPEVTAPPPAGTKFVHKLRLHVPSANDKFTFLESALQWNPLVHNQRSVDKAPMFNQAGSDPQGLVK